MQFCIVSSIPYKYHFIPVPNGEGPKNPTTAYDLDMQLEAKRQEFESLVAETKNMRMEKNRQDAIAK